MWKNGTTKTTQIGYMNRNNQKNHGTRGVKGTDHGQSSYKLECLSSACGHEYGATAQMFFSVSAPGVKAANLVSSTKHIARWSIFVFDRTVLSMGLPQSYTLPSL